jgi:siderophore synthetase component
MLIADILKNPVAGLRHMERYVNVGSPSGFTALHTTSWETNPCGPAPSFNLHLATFDSDRIIDEGPPIPYLAANQIAIHPDMANEPLLTRSCKSIRLSDIAVVPTSSSRTVDIASTTQPGYYKLSYKGLLGRTDRQISRLHAVTGVELTAMLTSAIEGNRLPPTFSFLPEPSARVAILDDENAGYEWGMVYRASQPYPPLSYTFAIPVFSLFSKDKCHIEDPLLLTQLINRQNLPADQFLFTEIISPLLACYFQLLLTSALQLECHAQNALIAFDEGCHVKALIFRDLESVDKDISLAEDLGIHVRFRSAPYKCLERSQYNYTIMHSFMYDFKLGEYFIKPLVELVQQVHNVDTTDLIQNIRQTAQSYIARLPEGFFPPDGSWYYYENVIYDRTKRRPYVSRPGPKYR